MIIGISGKKGSGKTFIARKLAAELNAPVLSFASPLKEIVRKCCGLTEEVPKETLITIVADLVAVLPEFDAEILSKIEAAIGGTYGLSLQRVGTEVFRKIDENYWVKLAKKRAADYPICIFDDCRFPNEAVILDHIVRVRGPPIDDSRDISHSSEVAMDDFPFNYYIDNDGKTDSYVKQYEEFKASISLA